MVRAALIYNIPVPYRVPVLTLAHNLMGHETFTIYEAPTHANRHWLVEVGPNSTIIGSSGRFRPKWIRLWSSLSEFKATVVVINGYGPFYLTAVFWALFNHAAVVVHTDGTLSSEERLTVIHRWVRRIVSRFAGAFVTSGSGGRQLYEAYGIESSRVFESPLAVNNEAFERESRPYDVRRFDVLICGRLEEVKNPIFALEVAAAAAGGIGRKLKVRVVGAGPLIAPMKEKAAEHADVLEVDFVGFVQSADLPEVYGDCRVLLFPSFWDPWGLVVNEARAASAWVICSDSVGARELLEDFGGGIVLHGLELESWVSALIDFLGRPVFGTDTWRHKYNMRRAADGIVEAIHFAYDAKAGRRETEN